MQNHTFKLQASSTYDDIKLKWMDACFSLSEDVQKYRNLQEDIASEGSVQTEMRWGLKREKKHVRFTEEIKMYLNEIFQRGKNNGKKVHPLTLFCVNDDPCIINLHKAFVFAANSMNW